MSTLNKGPLLSEQNYLYTDNVFGTGNISSNLIIDFKEDSNTIYLDKYKWGFNEPEPEPEPEQEPEVIEPEPETEPENVEPYYEDIKKFAPTQYIENFDFLEHSSINYLPNNNLYDVFYDKWQISNNYSNYRWENLENSVGIINPISYHHNVIDKNYLDWNNNINFHDDNYLSIKLDQGFKFFNQTYFSVNVNSNGYLTFGSNKDIKYYDDINHSDINLYFSKPRISALSSDFNLKNSPNGKIYYGFISDNGIDNNI